MPHFKQKKLSQKKTCIIKTPRFEVQPSVSPLFSMNHHVKSYRAYRVARDSQWLKNKLQVNIPSDMPGIKIESKNVI